MSDTKVSIMWEAVNYIRVEENKKAFPQVSFVDVSSEAELDQDLIGEIFLVTHTRETAEPVSYTHLTLPPTAKV